MTSSITNRKHLFTGTGCCHSCDALSPPSNKKIQPPNDKISNIVSNKVLRFSLIQYLIDLFKKIFCYKRTADIPQCHFTACKHELSKEKIDKKPEPAPQAEVQKLPLPPEPILALPIIPAAITPAQPPKSPMQKADAAARCMFPHCQRKPFVEATGRIHDFCGRTHAEAFLTRISSARANFPSVPDPVAIGHLAKSGSIIFYDRTTTPITECFSNFYMKPLTFLGKTYACSEAAFQAQKFPMRPDIQSGFQTLDGDGAYRLAKQHRASADPNWISSGRNVEVMREVLKVKFSDPDLKAALLATSSAKLVEHIPVKGRDAFWGDDCDGSGKNMLGRILEEIRTETGCF